MKFKFNEESLSMLDVPWLHRQVEEHLIFGPFSRYFGFGWIIVLAFAVNIATSLPTSLTALEIIQLIEKIFPLVISCFLLKMTKYRQAAIGWCLTKIMLAIICFIMLLAGGLVGFF